MVPEASPSDPIPFITLPNWVKAATRCGFNIQPIFDELSITTDLLHLETATIERTVMEALMGRCVASARDQHFPFALGETFAFDYLPDLEAFLTTSPTLREATGIFDWVRELIDPMLTVTLHEHGDTAVLALRFADPSADPPTRPWLSEAMFASILKFGRMLVGDDAPFTVLRFRHPPPRHAAAYEPFFRVPVRFNEAQHALEYPRRLLDLPLSGGYPTLHEQARQRIERRARAMPRRSGVVAEIERALAHRPALLGAGIDAVAEEIGLHPRTLQRRLTDAGTRFGTVQAQARRQLAERYLADATLDIETISERLGFSDRRSFTRAFTRWTGETPSAWRARGGD